MIGRWALIDIETSGVDPSEDQVIDLGFVIFDERKPLKEFSFKLKTDVNLDPIIVALTGITVPQLHKEGKTWDEIAPELEILQGCVLIAHNASFEESFLKNIFEKMQIQPRQTDDGRYFHDSLDVLPFLLPYFPRLGLESINQIFQLWPKEKHQGLEDAKDLADALIYAHCQASDQKRNHICEFQNLSSWWKSWLMTTFDYSDCKRVHHQEDIPHYPSISQWIPEQLTAFATFFTDKHQNWLSLKMIQMIGRGISGMVSLTHT